MSHSFKSKQSYSLNTTGEDAAQAKNIPAPNQHDINKLADPGTEWRMQHANAVTSRRFCGKFSVWVKL